MVKDSSKGPYLVQSRIPTAKRECVSVIKLTDLIAQLQKLCRSKFKTNERRLELPYFCRNAHKSKDGCHICFEVANSVKTVTDKLSDQLFCFVFCCILGAKILVVKIAKDVYLAFCRSPIKHLSHLKKAALLSQRNVHEVEKNWEKLPEFNLGFIESVIEKMKQMGVAISAEIEHSMRELGRAYGLFEFDIVVYNTLETISRQNSHHRGIITISFASKPKGEPIVRIVRDQVGPDAKRGEILIVGLVVKLPSSGKLKDCLKLSIVKKVTEALLPQNGRPDYWFPASGDGKWDAKVDIYIEKRSYWEPSWRKYVQEQTIAGLDVGAGTAYTRLLQELPKSNVDRFKQVVCKRADPQLHEVTVRGRKTLRSQALEDLRNAMGIEGTSAEWIKEWDVRKQRIENLLRFVELYPFLTIAPPEQARIDRVNLLLRDFGSGSSKYINVIKTALEREEVRQLNSTFKDFQRELSAFRRMLPTLMRTCPGEFVAVLNGDVVDRDKDEFELAERICNNYTNQFVLIREVKEEILDTVALESPEGVTE